MSNSALLMRVLLVAISLSVASNAQRLDTKSLRDILSKQGFSGTLEGKISFSFLGNMKCSSAAPQVYYYTWEETNPPGRAIHASYRVIFIEDRKYLGQYVVADRPTLIKRYSLRFPYAKDDGNSIQCDQDGLPESVQLNGDYIALER